MDLIAAFFAFGVLIELVLVLDTLVTGRRGRIDGR